MPRKYTRKTIEERFWAKVDKSGDCWLWTAYCMAKGYGVFGIHRTTELAHRVSWQLAHGDIPDGLFVLHNCPDGDNPACVNPAHLFLGTDAINKQDMVTKGRSSRGERRNSAKLTDDRVRLIRELYAAGKHNGNELAEMFAVSHSAVYNLLSGRTWRHLL